MAAAAHRSTVIILCGPDLAGAAVFGVTAILPTGSASGDLTEPIKPRRTPMQQTILILDGGRGHFVQRQGFQGNREFYLIASVDGSGPADELSLYERGTFSGASQLMTGEKVKISQQPFGKPRPAYFLNGGRVLGWDRGTGQWAVLRSGTIGDDPRQRLLNLATQVGGTENRPIRVSFSVRYVPEGFVPSHASHTGGDAMGEWLFGLSKGPIGEQAQLTFTVNRLHDPENTRTRKALGEPDSRAFGRERWDIKTGNEIVLRTTGCYGHIGISDVSLIPKPELERVVDGFTLGLCGDTREWGYPFP